MWCQKIVTKCFFLGFGWDPNFSLNEISWIPRFHFLKGGKLKKIEIREIAPRAKNTYFVRRVYYVGFIVVYDHSTVYFPEHCRLYPQPPPHAHLPKKEKLSEL